MGLNARRGASFPPEMYDDILRGEPKTQVPTKQTVPFRKPQEDACETGRLTYIDPHSIGRRRGWRRRWSAVIRGREWGTILQRPGRARRIVDTGRRSSVWLFPGQRRHGWRS